MFRWLILAVGVLLVSGSVSLVSAASPTAKLRISPASGTVAVGGTLAVDVLLDTGGQATSYVVGTIAFSDNLEFVNGNSNNSVMTTTVQAPAANGQTVRFELARTQDEGYNGSSGHVVRLAFRPKSEGKVTLTFDQGSSQVLAFEDSSNILSSVGNGDYTVAASPSTTTSSTASSSSGTSSSTSSTTSKASPKATTKGSASNSPEAVASQVAVAPDVSTTPSLEPTSTPTAVVSALPQLADDIDRSNGQATTVLGKIGQTATTILAIIGALAVLALLVLGGRWLRKYTAVVKPTPTPPQPPVQTPTAPPVPPTKPSTQPPTGPGNQPPPGQL